MRKISLFILALFVVLGACNKNNIQQQPAPSAMQQQQQQVGAPNQYANTNNIAGSRGGNTGLGSSTSTTVTPVDPTKVPRAKRDANAGRIVQVALLLDTSNSMDGLIDQAKSQLWKMVNELSLARDSKGEIPQIELALYEYGNDGLSAENGYIRQISPLTTDLDLISEKLFALSTNGGSEYCGYVINDAAQILDWQTNNEELKLIIIAGNEEYTQGPVNYKEACKKAISKGIVINTIFCGNWNEGVRTQWKDGADCADGKYLNIDQDRKVVHIEAPQDSEINRLNNQLNDTYIGYGQEGINKKERQMMQDANAASYSTANAAQRAISKASKAYKNDDWDIVDAYKEKRVDIKAIAKDELPNEMKNMTGEQREQFVKQKMDTRTQLQDHIAKLSEERRQYVAAKEREIAAQNPEANTLDAVMLKAIREQAAKKGFRFKL